MRLVLPIKEVADFEWLLTEISKPNMNEFGHSTAQIVSRKEDSNIYPLQTWLDSDHFYSNDRVAELGVIFLLDLEYDSK